MRIESLTIKNLRSIDSIELAFDDMLAVLVGKNSCGKSNVLRAVELFFTGRADTRPYNPISDMPVWIMGKTAPQARTTIKVSFLLEPNDTELNGAIDDFYAGKNVVRPDAERFTLIRYFTRTGKSGFQALSGAGVRETEGLQLNELSFRLLSKIEFRYIPSLKDLQSLTYQQISAELKGRLLSAWSNVGRQEVREKREAFDQIRGEIAKLLQDSSASLAQSIQDHFPSVSGVQLEMASNTLEEMIGNLQMVANDGNTTPLAQKGSGVQAASVIHMLRVLRETSPRNRHQKRLFLWCIEEPETFLHPSSQRKLASLLKEYSNNTQILITTHSPLFVRRDNWKANHLLISQAKDDHCITKQQKIPKKDPMRPIRKALGTSLGDSLALHECVVLVEGISDQTTFSEALRRLHSRGETQMNERSLVFLPCNGASSQKTIFDTLVGWSPMTQLYAIFDNDKAGRDDGVKRLLKAHSLKEDEDYFLLPKSGDEDVVLEDLYPSEFLERARSEEAVCQYIETRTRPGGEIISTETKWNKDELALHFMETASDEEWEVTESFVLTVVKKIEESLAL